MPGARYRRLAWVVAMAVAIPACRFDLPGIARDAAGDADAMSDGPIGDASNDWWDPAWTRRRQITIRHTELTGPLQKFPLLVRLPAGVGGAGGNDLRFLATDQRTVLAHELDTADASGAAVWVRIPDLPNTGPAPILWIYYGNAAAQSTSNGANVFGDVYVSVHHLGPDLTDASGHAHTAMGAVGATPPVTAGRIGGARDFDGVNDYLDLAGEAAYDFTTSFTVSAWIRVQALTIAYQSIVTKGDGTWRLHRENQTTFIGFGTTVASANQNHFGNINIDDGTWHHVAIVLGNSTKRIFVDGQLDQSDVVGPTIDTTNALVSIGRNSESQIGGTRNWNGDIDEVRISTAARDASWMFAEHHTAVDADFVQIGPEEALQ